MAFHYAENLYEKNKTDPPGDYVRLLRPAECSRGPCAYDLRTFSLQKAPPYTALSYSWGTQPQDAPVTLSQSVATGSFHVTSDLLDMLKRFDTTKRGREDWLWVDQVCINQFDDLEKGTQVSKMRSIYRNAEYVIVWLGKEMEHDNQSTRKGEPNYGLTCAKIFDLLDQGIHAWWYRLWVIQEVVSCNKVFVWIGYHCIQWDSFVKEVMRVLDELAVVQHQGEIPKPEKSSETNTRLITGDAVGRFIETQKQGHLLELLRKGTSGTPSEIQELLAGANLQVRALENLRSRLPKNSNGEDLVSLLMITLPLGVTNQLDRIFSLLGLATEDYRRNVPVAYGVPLRVSTAAVVQQPVKHRGNFEVLFKWSRGLGSLVQPGQKVHVRPTYWKENPTNHAWQLPTWMPDFLQKGMPELARLSRPDDAAGTFVASKMTVCKDHYELYLTAFAFDIVAKIYVLPTDGSLEDPPYSGQFSRAILAKLCPEFVVDIDKRQSTSELERDNKFLTDVDFLLRYSAFEWDTKVCFSTIEGHLGYTSAVEIGDEVIVPFGAQAPFIVRPIPAGVADEEGAYHLCADCYVESIMNGELEHLTDRGGIESREYRIR